MTNMNIIYEQMVKGKTLSRPDLHNNTQVGILFNVCTKMIRRYRIILLFYLSNHFYLQLQTSKSQLSFWRYFCIMATRRRFKNHILNLLLLIVTSPRSGFQSINAFIKFASLSKLCSFNNLSFYHEHPVLNIHK